MDDDNDVVFRNIGSISQTISQAKKELVTRRIMNHDILSADGGLVPACSVKARKAIGPMVMSSTIVDTIYNEVARCLNLVAEQKNILFSVDQVELTLYTVGAYMGRFMDSDQLKNNIQTIITRFNYNPLRGSKGAAVISVRQAGKTFILWILVAMLMLLQIKHGHKITEISIIFVTNNRSNAQDNTNYIASLFDKFWKHTMGGSKYTVDARTKDMFQIKYGGIQATLRCNVGNVRGARGDLFIDEFGFIDMETYQAVLWPILFGHDSRIVILASSAIPQGSYQMDVIHAQIPQTTIPLFSVYTSQQKCADCLMIMGTAALAQSGDDPVCSDCAYRLPRWSDPLAQLANRGLYDDISVFRLEVLGIAVQPQSNHVYEEPFIEKLRNIRVIHDSYKTKRQDDRTTNLRFYIDPTVHGVSETAVSGILIDMFQKILPIVHLKTYTIISHTVETLFRQITDDIVHTMQTYGKTHAYIDLEGQNSSVASSSYAFVMRNHLSNTHGRQLQFTFSYGFKNQQLAGVPVTEDTKHGGATMFRSCLTAKLLCLHSAYTRDVKSFDKLITQTKLLKYGKLIGGKMVSISAKPLNDDLIVSLILLLYHINNVYNPMSWVDRIHSNMSKRADIVRHKRPHAK